MQPLSNQVFLNQKQPGWQPTVTLLTDLAGSARLAYDKKRRRYKVTGRR